MEVRIKEEPAEYVLTQEQIKIEEPALTESIPSSAAVLIERKFICSMCGCLFDAAHNKQLTKCNKCILHTRLHHVFQKKRTKEALSEDVVNVRRSVLIKKLMHICHTCHKPFERSRNVKLHQPSDAYKCNKCILHAKIGAIKHLKS